MTDTATIKQQVDLRQIIAHDLGQPPIRSGRASLINVRFTKS